MPGNEAAHRLAQALAELLEAPDLNYDELEPSTQFAVEQAREILDIIRHGLKRFRVRYARTVVMETEVLVESRDDILHMPLPGVYEGISTDQIPKHVKDVQDHDRLWHIEPA